MASELERLRALADAATRYAMAGNLIMACTCPLGVGQLCPACELAAAIAAVVAGPDVKAASDNQEVS